MLQTIPNTENIQSYVVKTNHWQYQYAETPKTPIKHPIQINPPTLLAPISVYVESGRVLLRGMV